MHLNLPPIGMPSCTLLISKTYKQNSYESMKKDFYKKQDAISNARVTQESNVLDDF